MTNRPVRTRVQHGDPTCADYGCKREECLQARRWKQKRNKLLRTTGRPGHVSAGRAAAHLQKFRAAGLLDKEILGLVPIPRNTFYRVMRGEPLTRGSEQKILAVPLPPAAVGEIRTLSTVEAAGTHRRLQALVWLGWPRSVLEERMGVHACWITRHLVRARVSQAVQARVLRLYDELWNVQPELQGVDAGRAEAARVYARARLWDGPLAWDDDTIDDPKALPATDAMEPAATEGGNVAARWLMGESVILGRDDRREVLAHLYEWTNDTTVEIAARLEMTPAAAERQWERLKERAAADGRRLWRRVYVPREREIKQDELEEAA
jgi:hypothetical protein